jgi:hypothetical protein
MSTVQNGKIDWRAVDMHENDEALDNDEQLAETPPEVIALLGFDPLEFDEARALRMPVVVNGVDLDLIENAVSEDVAVDLDDSEPNEDWIKQVTKAREAKGGVA